jgi:integrase
MDNIKIIKNIKTVKTKKTTKHIHNVKTIKVQKTTKRKRNLRSCIDKEVLDYLLELIEQNESDEHVKFNMKLLNILLYYTGLRINELLLLNKLNILELFDRGKLNVFCKKTNDFRTVFLKGNLKIKCINHLGSTTIQKMNDKGIVNKWNNPITLRTAINWMNDYWDKLELKFGGKTDILKGRAFGFHSYRINFINQVVRSGDLDQASKIIGHKNPLTTLIYFRRLENKEEDVVDILDNANF